MSKRGKHVPSFLHEEFKLAIGGDPQSADQRLRLFYEAREHGWPEGPIGDEPIALWRKEFAASFPSVAPAKVSDTDVTALALKKVQAYDARWKR